MGIAPGVVVDDDALAAFCRRTPVERLRLFGSALHGRLRDDSDIDVLVDFEPGRAPGLRRLAAMELELQESLRSCCRPSNAARAEQVFRDEVSATARVCYQAA